MVAYQYTPDDLAELEACAANPDEGFKESRAKKNIKQHCIESQKKRCCYCNRLFPSKNGKIWDLEHIIHKKGYPRFRFEPLNLCISCPDCNGKKGNQEVLVDRLIGRQWPLPRESADYIIPHPHLDDWGEHIISYEGHVYSWRQGSAKGEALIKMLKFNHSTAAKVELRQALQQTEFSILSHELDRHLETGNDDEVLRVAGEMKRRLEDLGVS